MSPLLRPWLVFVSVAVVPLRVTLQPVSCVNAAFDVPRAMIA